MNGNKSLDRLKITGGQPLKGHVRVSGSKNAALPIMAACILGTDEILLENVPNLTDIKTMAAVLESLGVGIHFSSDNQIVVDPRHIHNSEAPYELVTKMRASFFVLGPILARMGHAKVSLPGGCSIGTRPVDLHLKGLRAMGAEIEMEHGDVIARASELRGAHIYLDFPSVGATENIMMAATLAKGTTIIDNAAQEPEIEDLAKFLRALGAKIKGDGTDRILIEGVEKLDRSATHSIMSDRIEAGTFITAAAMNHGDIVVERVPINALQAVIGKLRECKVNIALLDSDKVAVKGLQNIQPTDIRTMPFPGFPTDMQAQMVALLSVTKGTSVVTETVFENRFMYIDELKRMGAKLQIQGNAAIIKGVERLSGAPVMATDLRAGAALVMAGLQAEGETVITNLHHLDRGYENLEMKLSQLGAKICRINVKAQKEESILATS